MINGLMNEPLAQLLLLPLLGVLPLDAIDRELASLRDDVAFVLAVSELLQQGQAVHVAQRSEGLGSFMAAHGVLLHIGQDGAQGLGSLQVGGLAQAVGELMLEQGRGGGEAGGDGINGLLGLGRGFGVPGEMLEREEGAESQRKWGGLGAQGLAQAGNGGDRGVGGHFCCRRGCSQRVARRG